MSAPDLATLLNVEPEVESVLAAYLANLMGVAVMTSDSDQIEFTPRVEIVATVLEQGPHQNIVQTGVYAGRRFYDFFRVSIAIDVVYAPSAQQNAGTIRGKVRSAFTDYQGIAAGFAINGYLLLASDSFRQNAGSRSVNADQKEARTSSTLDCVFQINPAAIPQ